METNSVAAGFPAYTRGRWETDQAAKWANPVYVLSTHLKNSIFTRGAGGRGRVPAMTRTHFAHLQPRDLTALLQRIKEAEVAMARLIRRWPLLHNHCFSNAALIYVLSESLTVSTKANSPRLSLTKVTASNRSLHFRPRGPKLPNSPTRSDFGQGGNVSDSDSEANKSRNQKKREARRAVQWGMELASFSPPQIKRIIKVASLEKGVFDALMLVKRLGPDVREGKRRQYNYIGKLLRDVEPELMDALIYSTKDGDWSRLQGFSGLEEKIVGDKNEGSEESEYEVEEEVSHEYIDVATRWFDGLINRDVKVTNEVYALSSVDLDRQELRKLVRRVHAVQERKGVTEENEQEVDTAITGAKKSLTRFLRGLAKQMASEASHIDL
ncbi:unnamed protein product [Dovyalis caffra]|uniref:Uncharacterized protein n=1 Tax=Dovyalis caffra TaxID=77055 RepID=A0AAV1S5K8_9ROSI|nr:unnamed protein product [Dovyalis caffra]